MRSEPFERGAAVISIDTEQIWGHFDRMNETQFEERYPRARALHDSLLELLVRQGIPATWTVVGMLAMQGSKGPADERFEGLPGYWRERIPSGNEHSRPLWYARSFVRRLKRARVGQEIGMHGGISHLVWGDGRTTAAQATRELRSGMAALEELGVHPSAFVFPRDLEAHHAVLRDAGIRSFRGRAPIVSERFGYGKFGSAIRTAEELLKQVPPVVWPEETIPGLWNLRASMFLYCLGAKRSRWVAPRLRVERTILGLEAAAKERGVFHLGLHPENLAESEFAIRVFEDMIAQFARARDRGMEILTLSEAVDRVAVSKERATA
jgi:hypothetical protein